ncbi:outer membrane beta-barrel protein [Gemmatimonas sp.]|uniref:outer membrane beta-barrel protein n=1 Tax=Gemmatimonas sp. TaxID=1962908 RepID=UPI003F7310F6
MKSYLVRTSLAAVLVAASPLLAQAQKGTGVGAHLAPFAGYLITGDWYDGPVGTSIAATNAPMLGVQGGIPLSKGVSLVGNLAYASGDLRIGLPLLGGVNVGSANTWMYDVGLELGGLAGRSTGIAPFVQGGIGGMTNDIKASVFETRASNVAYTAGVGVDLGISNGLVVRVQAKDWISRFNSEDAVGFRVNGNLAHNVALTAGVTLRF